MRTTRALFLLPVIAVAILCAQRTAARADAQAIFTGEWDVVAPWPEHPRLPLRRVVIGRELSPGNFAVTFYRACAAPPPGLCAMGPITLTVADSQPLSISGYGTPPATPGSPTCRVVASILQTTVDGNPASKVTPNRMVLNMRRGRVCYGLPPYDFARTIVDLTRALPRIDPRRLPGG